MIIIMNNINSWRLFNWLTSKLNKIIIWLKWNEHLPQSFSYCFVSWFISIVWFMIDDVLCNLWPKRCGSGNERRKHTHTKRNVLLVLCKWFDVRPVFWKMNFSPSHRTIQFTWTIRTCSKDSFCSFNWIVFSLWFNIE